MSETYALKFTENKIEQTALISVTVEEEMKDKEEKAKLRKVRFFILQTWKVCAGNSHPCFLTITSSCPLNPNQKLWIAHFETPVQALKWKGRSFLSLF